MSTSDPCLMGAIDFGTGEICAAYYVKVRDGKIPSNIRYFRANGCSATMPAEAAYHEGTFYCGFQVRQYVYDSTLPAEKAIQFAKMKLYEPRGDERAPARVERVEQQLKDAGKTIEDLLTDCIKYIVAGIRQQAVKSFYELRFTEYELQNMPLKVRLSAPQIWSPQACSRMTEAARAAGIDLVTIVPEPSAALAYSLDVFDQEKGKAIVNLAKGDNILVADLGCGTGDFVMYQLKDDFSINSKLEPVLQAGGAICGSQEVNSFLLDILLEELEDVPSIPGRASRSSNDRKQELHRWCRKLNITEHTFIYQALKRIEAAKISMNDETRYHVHVDGARGNSETYLYTFTL